MTSAQQTSIASRLLEGKVAVIVGASRGIGATAARAFAEAGAKVVLAARNESQIRDLAGEIGDERALAVRTDVTDEASIRALVESAVARFGHLDVAMNNAAGGGHLPKPLAEVTAEEFDSSFAVNLRGYFLSMKYEIGAMLENGGGAIVNVSSTAGVRGWPGLAAYAATKHGIAGLTEVAALDYAARGIRVNTIAPGPIDTERTADLPANYKEQRANGVPMRRTGRAQEVAALAAWLCSDSASYITGTTIPIDGGQLAKIG